MKIKDLIKVLSSYNPELYIKGKILYREKECFNKIEYNSDCEGFIEDIFTGSHCATHSIAVPGHYIQVSRGSHKTSGWIPPTIEKEEIVRIVEWEDDIT